MTVQTEPIALQSTSAAKIAKTVKTQHEFFKTGITKDLEFRIVQLKKLRQAIVEREDAIFAALKADLNKHKFEAYGVEIGLVLGEIDTTIKKLKKWAKPKKVGTSMFFFKATSYIQPEPYGLALIIAPWNYPFQLLMSPLIGAMAAGNCCTLKPSEVAPHTSAVMTELIQSTFDAQYISIFEGGVPVSTALLNQKFDYIFFTGGTEVGRIVYQAAAKNLTPVTLELGGKSPCIVDKKTDLKLTAKRITWGKFVNAGQTCIAPDYIMVHKSVKAGFIDAMKEAITEAYGTDPYESDDYCRIISKRHTERLENLMKGSGKIAFGGKVSSEDKYISPTLLDNVKETDPIMQEEIFGPILPIMEYEDINDVLKFVNDRPKPLALYVFSDNTKLTDRVIHETSSGGTCINDTLMHCGNPELPFGGVGESGIGAYHGQLSFDTFSHHRAVMNRSTIIDPPVRYAPYKTSVNILKFVMSKLG